MVARDEVSYPVTLFGHLKRVEYRLNQNNIPEAFKALIYLTEMLENPRFVSIYWDHLIWITYTD